MRAAILGLAGPALTADERAFIRDADPAGFILFGRNIADKAQLRALTDSLRDLSGRADLPILIDQEGGRVARLGPPHWPQFPAPARFAALYEIAPMSAIEAARANAEAIAIILAAAGINVNAAPALDLLYPGADPVVGDRSFGPEPMRVAALGRAMLDGLAAGGVCGIVKHIPGHGRARADSHERLPVVDASDEELAADLAPFQALRDAPMAMTAHILYRAWDPERPATVSPTVIGEVIRGRIGYDGLLMSDDLAMGGLRATPGARAPAAVAAGCDLVLHCSGIPSDDKQIADAAGEMSEVARDRLARALAGIAGKASTQGYRALVAKRDVLLTYA
jgi:beta-N-acetylhexosaminidase